MTSPRVSLPRGFKAWLAGKAKPPLAAKPVPGAREVERMKKWCDSPDSPFCELRAALFPIRGYQPRNLIDLLDDLGQKELVGPISWAFRMLSHCLDGPTSRRVVSIPVARVLSHIWQPVRVTRLLQPSRGKLIPPVVLSEVRFDGERFYLVSDGNHRCEVAKLRGQDRVRAVIEGIQLFKPSDWQLTKQGVRHRRTGKYHKLAKDVRAAARWLGVKGG